MSRTRSAAVRRPIHWVIALVVPLAACSGAAVREMPVAWTEQSNVLNNVTSGSGYRVLHRFLAEADGSYPGTLIAYNGDLYGTTAGGGDVSGPCAPVGCGTVFRMSRTGEKIVLYRFRGGSDAASPYLFANLAVMHGTFYGTSGGGGNAACPGGCGTIYSLTPSGKENVLYRFPPIAGTAFSYNPWTGLAALGDKLYGVTGSGGRDLFNYCSCGIVFSFDPRDGAFKVIHRFDGADGSYPQGGPTASQGQLYGTTWNGGACVPCGVIFALSPTGAERVLFRFGGLDGANPQGTLLVHGLIYGTTELGGNYEGLCEYNGCGTVFRLGENGNERVLHRFTGGQDGGLPQAGLTSLNGALYGTTAGLGNLPCSAYICGTVFRITTTGRETVLHRFLGGSDGFGPQTNLVVLDGKLYGTTQSGGGKRCGGAGCGTVYEIAP